ncbi:helix-turn-helix domain-containing protein [Rhizobium daejeonense]
MTIPVSRFDSRILPAGAAKERWHDLISVLFDTQSLAGSEDDFRVQLNAWRIDDAAFAHMQASPHRFDRSRNKIARDGMDGYVLQFYTKGESLDRHGRYVARQGDLYVIDMAQPLSTRTNDHSHINMVLPRRLLGPLLARPDNCHETILNANLPLVALLRDTITSYVGNLSRLSISQAQASLDPIVGLAAAAINGSVSDGNAVKVNAALLARIRQFIEAHLLDMTLAVEDIMSQFGISRRHVYRLLEPLGGFQTHVRRRRLRLAYRALSVAHGPHLSISDIAAAHGFSNPEHFTRSFRQEFGMAPRELRFQAANRSESEVDEQKADTWSRWLVDIGR